MSASTVHPRPAPATATRIDARPHVFRLALLVIGLHRAISPTTVLADSTARSSTSLLIATAVTAAWGCVLLWDAWRHATFRQPLAAFDVALAAGIGLLGLSGEWQDTTVTYGSLQCAAVVAGWAMPARALTIALSALVSVPLSSVLVSAGASDITALQAASHAATLIVIALVAGGVREVLFADGTRRHAAEPAWDVAENRRVVHDTALATLTAIANGRLDAGSDRARALAARDATYLRTIMQGGTVTSDSLPSALAAVAADAAAVGLRLHPLLAPMPSHVDQRAVVAIAMAAREALNNVHRHARTREAWLTAGEEQGAIVARIVDRGVGFDPDKAPAGSGIRDSIMARMREAGGTSAVDSIPGEGTCVELRWPR